MRPDSNGAFALTAVNRERLIVLSDSLAAALAASLPWSTSATGILVVAWLIAVIPTLDRAAGRQVLFSTAGGLPVLLWLIGVAGMAWADVPFKERLQGLDSFHKLLFIPLLLAHFQRSERTVWVLRAFLVSCVALLAYSFAMLIFPEVPGLKESSPGVPVKDYISQSAMFTISIAIALALAFQAWQRHRSAIAALWIALALAFFVDILFAATSRTALVVLPVLILLFAFRSIGWKGGIAIIAALVLIGAAAWPLSSYLRLRVGNFVQEIEIYRAGGQRTSAGERLEFWTKSLRFIEEAPLIGHGTGTIRALFRKAATGTNETAGLVADNPHNQTLAVAIQLGLVGTIALYALWIAHLLLFRGGSFAAWLGLAIVVQNFIGSLFNSHLFDFTQGWGYVIGVGVAGGAVLRGTARPAPAEIAPTDRPQS